MQNSSDKHQALWLSPWDPLQVGFESRVMCIYPAWFGVEWTISFLKFFFLFFYWTGGLSPSKHKTKGPSDPNGIILYKRQKFFRRLYKDFQIKRGTLKVGSKPICITFPSLWWCVISQDQSRCIKSLQPSIRAWYDNLSITNL